MVEIYQAGARALGYPGQPERLLMLPQNLPKRPAEQQGFIGAAFLVHSLGLAAYLWAAAERSGSPMSFMAYTGESFGIITSAVTSGSLSVGDGVRIARAFTPLMMVAAEGADGLDDPFAWELAAYLPESVRGQPLVPEPSHVVALRGDAEDLAEILEDIGNFYPKTDVEVHKRYSWRQINIYVRAGIKPSFDLFMRKFPAVRVEELKAPTTFLAHSERMGAVRAALEQFIDENGIVFREPHTPVVSNHDAGLLRTGMEIRDGVLAMTNEVMASQTTVELLDDLDPDMIVELGLGSKSVRLLIDNNIEAPVLAFTGSVEETDLLLRAVRQMDGLLGELANLYASADGLEARHYDMLRGLFRLAAKSPFCKRYFDRTIGRVITNEMLHFQRNGSPAFYRFLESYQHTYHHRGSVDIDKGELVLQARLRKRVLGRPECLGQVYAELNVVDGAGGVADRSTIGTGQPEVVVFHFDRLPEVSYADLARKTRLLLTQPLARQIYNHTLADLGIEDGGFLTLTGATVPTIDQMAMSYLLYQYTLFRLLHLHRPAVFAQSDYYLKGSDPMGWLVALAVSGTLSLRTAVELHGAYLWAGSGIEGMRDALDRALPSLRKADVPIISPEGVPLQSKKDLAAATRAVFRNSAVDARERRIHLNGNCQILSLGAVLDPGRVDAGPYRTDVICVLSPADIWKKRVNPPLDDFEERCVLTLTDENERVLGFAKSRRILSSTVCGYVNLAERIVGFGKGGSESMTIFLKRAGEDQIVVRKILSEALTTANWNPEGQGVMLPPFAKAKKQAEYLQALPEAVRRYFPEVYDILERGIPIPPHLRKHGKTAYQEVIYEMGYVPGDEVSRFIEKHSPAPAVIARLYEQIFRVLHHNVHTVNRGPAPGETLDISYFKKIEDRLDLCRRTAPRTFCPELLDTERIVINGVPYLNAPALLRRFRERPEFLEILEPRYHCVVMGDTNTENIKVANAEPLLRAQRLIEAGAPRGRIDAALADITPESLGIRFLDPRAIGFRSSGGATRDDPMYDNKPWHNSIGHYDEIHYEQFKLWVETGEGRTPRVDIEFNRGNPYQRAYRVRDVAARGGTVDSAQPSGIEDYFGPVMTAVFGLDDPDPQYRKDDPHWLIRFVFMMGTHFTAMPPFHFQSELDGTLTDTYQTQRRPVAIYCEGIKWLNWALEMLIGERTQFLGVRTPTLPYLRQRLDVLAG